jgi:hypothetical protein
MTKKVAERPCLIHLQSEAFDDNTLCSLMLNANDVAEWEIGECIPELGASIFQVTFKGYPIQDDGTLTCLGSLLYDACDYGLEIHQLIGDALYEARHPWLDLRDALEKGCLKVGEDYLTLSILSNGTHDYNIYNCEENILPVVWTVFKDKVEFLSMDSYNIVAFKPIKPFDFYYFNQVKVWEMNT